MINLSAKNTRPVKESREFGIINFGDDNLYPNRVRNVALHSSGLKRCTKTYNDFLYGRGMSENADFWKKKINISGLRVDQFLRFVTGEYSTFKGFAFQVVYSQTFEIAGVVPYKFETLRLCKPDDFGIIKKIKYYKDWEDRNIKRTDIKEFHVYNPDPNIIMAQVAESDGWEHYKGQMFYFGDNGQVAYPYCTFHDVFEDAITDIQIKLGKNANSSTNFMPSHIIQLPFSWDEVARDYISSNPEEMRSVEQIAKNMRDDFNKKIQTFQGFENLGKIASIENPNRDAEGKMLPFAFKKLEMQQYDKIFEYTENSVRENIRSSFLIPKILLDPVSAGFSTQIMTAMYNYYNEITQDDRQIFEEVFMEIFGKWRYDINPLGNYQIIKLKHDAAS